MGKIEISSILSKKMVSQEKICPLCKRSFLVHNCDNWSYKAYVGGRRKVLCSWHCMREYEKTHTLKSDAKKKRAIENQLRGGY